MPTIRDIAKRAGVSVGTVSNYLNSPEIVSEKSKEIIQQAIKELGYHPHAAAQSLKSNQTHRLGMVPLISPEENRSLEPSDNAFLEFLAAVNTAAAENGYGLLLHAATSPMDELNIYKQMAGSKQVDGLILMGTKPEDARIDLLMNQGFPFITFGRSRAFRDHPYVDVDGAMGVLEAIDYLVSLGHQRIGYISPPDGLMCAEHRWQGYQTALKKHHLVEENELIVSGGFTEQSGQIAMHLLLDSPNPPTAVITANDLCAFGAMRAMQTRGLVPGKDLSVIGFDDIRLASQWHPSLTTIAQPFRKLGFTATQTLIDIIYGEDTEQHIILEPRLVIRNSTGPVMGS